MKKIEKHVFQGMQRDLSISKQQPQFLFDAHNIRLTQRDEDGSNLLTITNERGTVGTNITISGTTYLGHCLLNEYLVVFSTGRYDYIDMIDLENPDECVTLFQGNLNFGSSPNIETLGSYENDNVQKVYWTDGINQPRVINISNGQTVNQASGILSNVSSKDGLPVYTKYDFIRELQLNEEVKVKKLLGASGTFTAGVIQYAFTYYDKYGQESNIFYTSPLLYISYADRGGSPEDKISNAFQITVTDYDDNFEYLRIYSILRTSVNGTPICKRVQDISIKGLPSNEVTFIDTGTEGDIVDPTELLYKGGETITADTMTQKDGTLFFGNIELVRKDIDTKADESDDYIVKEIVQNARNTDNPSNPKDTTITEVSRNIYPTMVTNRSYNYYSQLTAFSDASKTNTVPCGGFKRGNTYRLGLQFQHKTGIWSEPVFIEDKCVIGAPVDNLYTDDDETKFVQLRGFKAELSDTAVNKLRAIGYVKVRPLVVFPDFQDRTVLCQGVTCPTVYTSNGRAANNPYAQASWFFRPFIKGTGDDYKNISSEGTVSPFGHLSTDQMLPYTDRAGSSSQQEGVVYNPENIRGVEVEGQYDELEKFRVTSRVSTLHSPDVEFDDSFLSLDTTGFKGGYVGFTSFIKTLSDIDIQTETPQSGTTGSGFIHKNFNSIASRGIVSGLFYDDCIVDDNVNGTDIAPFPSQKSSFKWLVYPWQRSGSLNNDFKRPADKGTRTAVLKKKIISNLRFANTHFFDFSGSSSISLTDLPFKVFSKDQVGIEKLTENGYIYQGNVDTLLSPNRSDGLYFAFHSSDLLDTDDAMQNGNIITDFDSDDWWKTFSASDTDSSNSGIFRWNGSSAWEKAQPISIGDGYIALVLSKEPVRMKYKSTPHIAAYTKDLNLINSYISEGFYLPIVEIRRDNITNRFGGTSDDALKANQWVPCGEPVVLRTAAEYDTFINSGGQHHLPGENDPSTGETGGNTEPQTISVDPEDTIEDYTIPTEVGGSSTTIDPSITHPYDLFNPEDKTHPGEIDLIEPEEDDTSEEGSETEGETNEPTIGTTVFYSYGDTYYQRWDCLKTYAFTPEDENQIVEIGSFTLETYVNIDGRYDRNRGQNSNLNMSPVNFNLMNPVYSQRDNFFTYRIMDKSFYENNSFPNQITWTKEKQMGADVDLWTNLTLASTYDLDGSKGEVISLNTWKDNIYCFQDKGISSILFNSRVQIPTSDGVPIEISNSYKVDGHRYVTDGIGCHNKWSIKETPASIYFIDSVSNDLYSLGDGLNDVSLTHNMKSWFKDHFIQRTLYDDVHHDIYLVGDSAKYVDEALCYSETLGQFTSFMSYDNVTLMESYGTQVFALKGSNLYKLFSGNYNYFFNSYKPWDITFISNGSDIGASDIDKIFTNIDYRMDMFEKDTNENKYIAYNGDTSFDVVRVWNEYQDTQDFGLAKRNNGTGYKTAKHYPKDSLQKKFKIWRIDIPRAKRFTNDSWVSTNDRIRNPWCKILLRKNNNSENDTLDSQKAVLQDLNVTYYL